MSTIALCESVQQVRWLVRQPEAARVTTWVGANCQAVWELERQQRPFVALEENEDDRFKGLADEIASGQIGWAEQTDEVLHSAIPELQTADFRPARHLLFHLKNVCDTIVHRASGPSRMADVHQPTDAFYFANSRPLHMDPALRGVVGSVLADVVPEWASRRRVNVWALPARPRDRWWEYVYYQRGLAKLRFAAAQSVHQFLPVAAVAAVRQLRKGRWTSPPVRTPDPSNPALSRPVLVQRGYDVNDGVWSALAQNGRVPVDVRHLTTTPLSSEGRQAANVLKEQMRHAWSCVTERQMGASVRFGDVPAGQALERQVSDFWHREIPHLWGHVVDARAALERMNPDAVFGSVFYYDRRDIALAAAARGLGIPLIHYQHGGTLGDMLETWDIAERYSGTHLLVYGTGCSDYLGTLPEVAGLHCRSVAVGSARLDVVAKAIPSDRISELRRQLGGRPGVVLVVLVADVIHHNVFRVSAEYRSRSVERFDLRRRVARLLGRLKSSRLVFKSFAMNAGDPTIEMIRTENADAQIVTGVPLTELQWAADVLVYESPGTALLEGALTDKPLIVHCDRSTFRFSEEALALIRRRAVVANDALGFLQAIEDAVLRPSPVPADAEYRRAFATHLDDGRSSERAAAAVSEIAAGD